MIKYKTYIIKLSNLFTIAMQLLGLPHKNRRNHFEEKLFNLLLLLLRHHTNRSEILLGSRAPRFVINF